MKKDTKKEGMVRKVRNKSRGSVGRGVGIVCQPILFTGEEYKELLKAFGAYTLLKQSSVLPNLEIKRLYGYIIEQGKKFEFEKAKMSEMDWFDKINDEVYESLFQYTQEEMWQHLANLFARRDVINEIEEETGLSEMELPPDTFLDAMGKKVQMYLKEFEKNGINNLVYPNAKKVLKIVKKNKYKL